MTAAEARIAYDAADEAFSAASRELRHAHDAVRRSKSPANLARLAKAAADYEPALEAAIATREAFERADRMERIAPYLAKRAARGADQLSLF